MVVDKNAIIVVNLSPKFLLGPQDCNSLLILMVRAAHVLYFELHFGTENQFHHWIHNGQIFFHGTSNHVLMCQNILFEALSVNNALEINIS